MCAVDDSLFYYMLMLSKMLIYLIYFYYAIKSRVSGDNVRLTENFMATDVEGINRTRKEVKKDSGRKYTTLENYERSYFKKTSATIRNILDFDSANKKDEEAEQESLVLAEDFSSLVFFAFYQDEDERSERDLLAFLEQDINE